MQHHPEHTTIAILGADTVVGSALCALLEGHGYRTAPIEAHPTGVVDEMLEGADLLLLAPRLDEGVQEAFVGAMGKRSPEVAGMPVVALRTAVEAAPPEEEGMLSVPWPCETKALVERIEAALLDVPPASTTSTIQARTDGSALGADTRPFVAQENPMRLVGGMGSSTKLRLPPGYRLERSDSDVLVLRDPQGAAIARFSAQGAAPEAIEREARKHHRERNRTA